MKTKHTLTAEAVIRIQELSAAAASLCARAAEYSVRDYHGRSQRAYRAAGRLQGRCHALLINSLSNSQLDRLIAIQKTASARRSACAKAA